MRCIEVKMRELGVSTHAEYKIALFLDHQSMVRPARLLQA